MFYVSIHISYIYLLHRAQYIKIFDSRYSHVVRKKTFESDFSLSNLVITSPFIYIYIYKSKIFEVLEVLDGN